MTDAAAATPKLRNVPAQARSRDRLERVLDAARRVLADEGAAALTTTRVADAAGISVGSLYHYFPDKEEIAVALALAYWSDFQGRVARVAELDADEPLDDPVGAVIDAVGEGFRAEPGFRALWYGGLRTEHVRDATRPGRAQFAVSIERMLATHWPDAKPELYGVTARMIVLIADGLLREAFRVDDSGDEALLAETKTVLRAYAHERLNGASDE